MTRIIYACLLSVVWSTLPALVSANTWPDFGARWIDRDAVTQGWFEQDSMIRSVAETRLHRDDRFGMDERERGSRETKESRAKADIDRDRSHESARSGNTTQSFSDVRDHPSSSVYSPSRRPDPWWGRGTEGDPMIRGLSRKPSGE